MRSLCFTPGAHGVSLSVSFGGGSFGARSHTAQVSAAGHGSSGLPSSSGISLQSSLSSSLEGKSDASKPSSWLPGGQENDGVALEGSVSTGPGGKKREEEEEIEGAEEDDRVALEGSVSTGRKREDEEEIEGEEEDEALEGKRRGNWVVKILQVASVWAEKTGRSNSVEERKDDEAGSGQRDSNCCPEQGSDVCCAGGGGEAAVEIDQESFSRMLRTVPLAEAREYAKMSYLGNLAYKIPKIKPGSLLKSHGLRFITSSLEKKTQSMNEEKGQTSVMEKKLQPFHDHKEIPNQTQELEEEVKEEYEAQEGEKQRKLAYRVSASTAYQIAAAAASYLQLQTRNFLPFGSVRDKTMEKTSEIVDDSNGKTKATSSGFASFRVTTNSVTAVVAGKEEMKQAVVKELSSAKSSPCEWFSCDDDSRATRYFIIQGSESLASWQANLLFEPVQFEELDVLVHRGIYEAAKGIYEQILPDAQAHLQSCGDSGTLCFTGHSLGGSLSLLINLMLLIRGEVPRSSLLPVVTFGAPYIMCGGDQLLQRLGLPRSHLQAITIHRDIVPRAFSCCYPDHVAELLMAVNGNFRKHPCLKNQRMLYAPMGELIILQPDDKVSPYHHLLPSGTGLYRLSCQVPGSGESARQLWAQTVFFNSPHPLEILSDPSKYGPNGSIYRNHDMHSYLRSIRNVIREEEKQSRKAERERRRQAWWQLLAPLQGFEATLID